MLHRHNGIAEVFVPHCSIAAYVMGNANKTPRGQPMQTEAGNHSIDLMAIETKARRERALFLKSLFSGRRAR